jgi:phytoene desaturase
MNIAESAFRALDTTEIRPTAVVIGTGFGGLAAAIRLGAKGYRVHMVEKLDGPGGRAYVYQQDGFTFDAGPTIVTAPFLLEELWEMCGRKFADDVDLRPMDPFFRIRFDDGRIFDYCGDKARNIEQIKTYREADVAGYERYLKASQERYKVGFEGLVDKPFDSLAALFKFLPQLIRLRSDRSVYQLVSRYIRDPQLRMTMSFHPLLIGGNPFSVTSVYTLISFLEQRFGVWSAMGGTGSIVEGMTSLIEGQGGKIEYNAEVEEILVSDGAVQGVRLRDGRQIKSDLVVSNADAAWTYRHMIPAEHRKRWTNRRIERSHFSNGLFVWYFGTQGKYPDVPHHSVILGPRYRGLLDDIFKHKVLAEDFSLYLHRPTETDPSMAPEGCDTFYALAPVPHLGANVDWSTYAETFKARICERLEQTMLPGLRDRVVTSRLLTPQDFHDRLNSVKGAAFGFEPRITQSAWFRPHNRSEDVAGLYLVGAGTHPGAGMPAVISSAKVIDQLIPAAVPRRAE